VGKGSQINTVSVPGMGIISITGGPFVTGTVKITDITTNVISIPGRGVGEIGAAITLHPAPTELVRTFTTGQGFLTSHPGASNILILSTVALSGSPPVSSGANAGPVTEVYTQVSIRKLKTVHAMTHPADRPATGTDSPPKAS
jgi:hypothetical protein